MSDPIEPIRRVLRDRGHYELAANDSLCADLLAAGQPARQGADDLDRAIAAAREALENEGHRSTDALRDLLAALDAARGEAVPIAWIHAGDVESQRQNPDNVAYVLAKPSHGYVPLYAAPPAALAVPPERDWTMIQSGDTSIPAWVIHYANAIGAYMKGQNVQHWAVGPVQSREQAPPAAAVPEDVLALLRDLAPALDAYEHSGRKSEIKDGALHWTLDARHYDAQRLRGRVDAMLAAAERKGE